MCAIAVALLVVGDVIAAPSPRSLRVQRSVKRSVRLGDSTTSTLTVANTGRRRMRQEPIFTSYTAGLQTNRDAWVYNFSLLTLRDSAQRLIETYNEERERIHRKKIKKNLRIKINLP